MTHWENKWAEITWDACRRRLRGVPLEEASNSRPAPGASSSGAGTDGGKPAPGAEAAPLVPLGETSSSGPPDVPGRAAGRERGVSPSGTPTGGEPNSSPPDSHLLSGVPLHPEERHSVHWRLHKLWDVEKSRKA